MDDAAPEDQPGPATRISAAVRSRLPVSRVDRSPEMERTLAKLDTTAKALSAGFAALTAVLTWAGLEDNRLQMILRTEPRLAIWVFILVGAGVLLGLITPLIPSSFDTRLVWPLVIAWVAGYISSDLLPDLEGGTLRADSGVELMPWLVGLAILATLASIAIHWATKATALLLGLLLFSMGMYGAVKTAVVVAQDFLSPTLTEEITWTDSIGDATFTSEAVGVSHDQRLEMRVLACGSNEDDEPELLASAASGGQAGNTARISVRAILPREPGREYVVSSAILTEDAVDNPPLNSCRIRTPHRNIARERILVPPSP